MIGSSCGTCHHFHKAPGDITGKLGKCQAHPPTAMLVISPQGPQILSDFPPVSKDLMCGEWKFTIKDFAEKGSANLLSDASQVNGG